MNWREFIASLVGDLAWPLVAVVAILVFRKALRQALRALLDKATGSVEGFGVALAWNELVVEAQSEALEVVGGGSEAEGPGLSADEAAAIRREFAELEEIASRDLGLAVIATANKLRVFLERQLEEAGARPPVDKASLQLLAFTALQQQAISRATYDTIQRWKDMEGFLRRQAVPRTADRVQQFINFTLALVTMMRIADRKLPE